MAAELRTRSEFLAAGAAATAAAGGLLALPARAAGALQARRPAAGRAAHPALGAPAKFGMSFVSRPDLHPPPVTVTGATALSGPSGEGLWCLAPTGLGTRQTGPLIVDGAGQPVWFNPLPRGRWAMNLRVQHLRGVPVLTWWEGEVVAPGYGQGEAVIADTTLREIARLRGARGRQIDLHEFVLTPAGTALVTCYPEVAAADLSAAGGPVHGQVYGSIFQELDVRTGRLLLEWRSLDHVALAESYVSPGGIYDYMHLNSIEVLPDGGLLVSARHTWALYKLARHTGRVIWRLGGKRSDFAVHRGARFAWQHDARHLAPGLITLFDDGAGPNRTESQSRGIALHYDLRRRSVRLARTYRSPQPLLASAMGNMQTLSDGNVVIGWGNVPVLSEFSPGGAELARLRLPPGRHSYRGFRLPWHAVPATPPAVAVARDPGGGNATLYVSWNGATDVAGWLVSTGSTLGQLQGVGTAPRAGFETAIPLGGLGGYVTVTAVDLAGRPLATSAPVTL